jgi:hypothetical protein
MVRFVELLERFDPLQWARATSLDNNPARTYPPFAVFRFRNPNRLLEDCIVEAIRTFRGRVPWEIYQGGRNRNWVVAPVRLREFFEQGSFATDSHANAKLEEEEPELGRQACDDLDPLRSHVEQALARAGFAPR